MILFAIKTMAHGMGGAEKVLTQVLGALASDDRDIGLVCFDGFREEPHYSLHEDVKLIRLGLGHAKGRARFWETVRRIARLRKIIKRRKPEVLIAFMHSMFIPTVIAAIGLKIPVVASEHIVFHHYRTRPLESVLMFLSLFAIDKIVVLSDEMKARYPRFLHYKIEIIPNPPPDLKVKAHSAIALRENVILSVGRLEAQKDQATLIHAFAQLADDFSDWRVVIRGEGGLRYELEGLIRGYGLEERIALPGVTNEIECEYLRAKIFALPSLYESFGLVTVEAMAAGLPAVGFADCPGTRDIIVNGQTGFLVSDQDRVRGMSDALKEMMQSEELLEDMSRESVVRVQEYLSFDPKPYWEVLIDEALSSS
ncbi:MAG: glycosyltransferase family 4 protein [Alphaproteobacteria bacterium]